MKIMILGGGGREHALALKLSESSGAEKIYAAPGNPGTSVIAENVDLEIGDFQAVADFIRIRGIDMVVVGPEEPLVNGIRDFLESRFPELMIIGPGRAGARLEGSKDFAKAFMMRNNIPTASYFTVDTGNIALGDVFIDSLRPPYVLKADGLAAGKGVLIVDDRDEAKRIVREILDGKFGKAGAKVVVEDFLKGIEISVFVLTDGRNYKLLGSAKDYKRIGEGDKGLNTGGMGAVSPVPFADEVFMHKVKSKIIEPTIAGLRREGVDYTGFIFFGLMNVDGEPYVIEYNVRMGDPETEVVLPRIKSDFCRLLEAAALGTVDKAECELDTRTAATVMLVSGGYPEAYEKDKEIFGAEIEGDFIVFHAGTKRVGDKLFTAGGRVMAVTSLGECMDEALEKSYRIIKNIRFDGMYYRKDIGRDL